MRYDLAIVSTLALAAGCALPPTEPAPEGLNRAYARDIRALQRDLIASEVTGSVLGIRS